MAPDGFKVLDDPWVEADTCSSSSYDNGPCASSCNCTLPYTMIFHAMPPVPDMIETKPVTFRHYHRSTFTKHQNVRQSPRPKGYQGGRWKS